MKNLKILILVLFQGLLIQAGEVTIKNDTDESIRGVESIKMLRSGPPTLTQFKIRPGKKGVFRTGTTVHIESID